jgi:uncharacterized membrane protein YkvA (DUF1232 family)
MSLEFHIEITDDDMPVFVEALSRAELRAAGKSAQQVLAEATKTFNDSKTHKMPEFVRSRLATVEALIAMAGDVGWALGEDDRNRIISALTYFADPEDLIPDNVPVLGFLDDAIMIEVVQRVLQPELEAYGDFCSFRNIESEHRGIDPATIGREEWLEERRAELQMRMRNRRSKYAPSGNWTPQFKFT